MTDHRDTLEALNTHLPMKEKLVQAHEIIRQDLPFVARIAIAIYDPQTRILKTYLHSSGDDNPLEHYQALIDDAPSLKHILEQGKPRVINNLLTFEHNNHEHTRRIGRQGYAASYTLPMFDNGNFIGFIFFNSYETDVFTEKALRELDLFGHMFSLMVINEISVVDTLTAAINNSSSITHVRDPETGSHLDRMSRYCQLIARTLANKHDLDDDYIEHVFMFAPLHDIGKIGIPDNILLKPGKLNGDEENIMRNHARLGREMIDNMIRNFKLEAVQHIDVLRNIAEYHHEAVNGTGYPKGLKGDEIPFEARIVAVADVFDALTSRRVYKNAWSNDDAFAALQELADSKLDRDCVDALINNRETIEQIQQQFQETMFG